MNRWIKDKDVFEFIRDLIDKEFDSNRKDYFYPSKIIGEKIQQQYFKLLKKAKDMDTKGLVAENTRLKNVDKFNLEVMRRIRIEMMFRYGKESKEYIDEVIKNIYATETEDFYKDERPGETLDGKVSC